VSGPLRDPHPRRPRPHWSGWFQGLQVSSDEPGQTLIAGSVVDQAALHGLLAKVRDLGLPLLSVQRIGPGPEPEEQQEEE
jgi:hypothetical protein